MSGDKNCGDCTCGQQNFSEENDLRALFEPLSKGAKKGTAQTKASRERGDLTGNIAKEDWW